MRNKLLVVLIILGGLFFVSYIISNFFIGDKIHFKDKIVIIPIRGMITLEGKDIMPFEESVSSEVIVDYIKQANRDDSIKGILLDINSPGGTVVASKEIADSVRHSKKPVVAVMREIATSGAYWIASATDKIIADPLTITGSIGVTGSYIELSELMDKYGVNYERIVSGKYKDTGSPFRRLSDEEKDLLVDKTKKTHLFFIKQITNNRNISPETIKEISNGGIYLGFEAYNLGLVDYLGNKDGAINITKELANITSAELVKYKPKMTFIHLLSKISMKSFYYMGAGIGSRSGIKEDRINLIL
jgi:protease-4